MNKHIISAINLKEKIKEIKRRWKKDLLAGPSDIKVVLWLVFHMKFLCLHNSQRFFQLIPYSCYQYIKINCITYGQSHLLFTIFVAKEKKHFSKQSKTNEARWCKIRRFWQWVSPSLCLDNLCLSISKYWWDLSKCQMFKSNTHTGIVHWKIQHKKSSTAVVHTMVSFALNWSVFNLKQPV